MNDTEKEALCSRIDELCADNERKRRLLWDIYHWLPCPRVGCRQCERFDAREGRCEFAVRIEAELGVAP